jgi:hypothetical protein
MFKGTIAAAMLAASAVAAADTVYPLPDPTITVNPSVYGNTIVSVDGVVYRGPTAFVYVSECPTPDGPRYHCNIVREDNVPLYATDGSGAYVTVTLVVQMGARLITSGHNWWRSFAMVLDGSVTVPDAVVPAADPVPVDTVPAA